VACTRHCNIHDDIMQMPMGYETLIGELGGSLSGGQKQRLLIARALYRRPNILFMDEATSHLDLANEMHINNAIAALKITRIIIAHRPSTIASADRVVSLAPPEQPGA
ncbi:ATP-binding cassette domain-containing protein, partial [Serratia entomophila]